MTDKPRFKEHDDPMYTWSLCHECTQYFQVKLVFAGFYWYCSERCSRISDARKQLS